MEEGISIYERCLGHWWRVTFSLRELNVKKLSAIEVIHVNPQAEVRVTLMAMKEFSCGVFKNYIYLSAKISHKYT
jgi:hypothetical protein